MCHERCHTGPCPQTCRETVVRSCECGKTQRTMQVGRQSAARWSPTLACYSGGVLWWDLEAQSSCLGYCHDLFMHPAGFWFYVPVSPPPAMQCQEGAFRCERRCTSMRSCGRHPCRRRCCDSVSCPPCEEVCGKWLKCRNHRCAVAGWGGSTYGGWKEEAWKTGWGNWCTTCRALVALLSRSYTECQA